MSTHKKNASVLDAPLFASLSGTIFSTPANQNRNSTCEKCVATASRWATRPSKVGRFTSLGSKWVITLQLPLLLVLDIRFQLSRLRRFSSTFLGFMIRLGFLVIGRAVCKSSTSQKLASSNGNSTGVTHEDVHFLLWYFLLHGHRVGTFLEENQDHSPRCHIV